MARRRPTYALLSTLALTAGCLAESQQPSTGGVPPAAVDGPSVTVLDPSGFAPPTEPQSGGPRTRVQATVDLSGVGSASVYALQAIPAGDGAYAVVVDQGGAQAAWLVTIGPGDGGLEVTDSFEHPAVQLLRRRPRHAGPRRRHGPDRWRVRPS